MLHSVLGRFFLRDGTIPGECHWVQRSAAPYHSLCLAESQWATSSCLWKGRLCQWVPCRWSSLDDEREPRVTCMGLLVSSLYIVLLVLILSKVSVRSLFIAKPFGATAASVHKK